MATNIVLASDIVYKSHPTAQVVGSLFILLGLGFVGFIIWAFFKAASVRKGKEQDQQKQ